MKKVLVTGARGLLGSACVTVLSKDYSVQTTEGDLRNQQTVYWTFDKLRPDYVIHCAARVGGVKANRDFPVEFIEDNVAMNSNIIAACHLFGVKKLVNIATSCLYPKNAPVPVKEESLLTGPFEPDVAAYATAKLLAYMTCNAYRTEHGSNFVTVAPGNLFGQGDNYGPSSHVIPSLIHKAFEAKENNTALSVWGDGTAIREFLHADDAAAAIKVVLERFDGPELVNIGSGVGTPIKAIAEAIAAIVGVKHITYDTAQPVGIKEKTFDISRITSLGWSPKISLREGLIMACEEYQQCKIDGTLRFK